MGRIYIGCIDVKNTNETGAETSAICGYSGGKSKGLAKYNIHVNIGNMQIVEDVHMMLDHLMMYILAGKLG